MNVMPRNVTVLKANTNKHVTSRVGLGAPVELVELHVMPRNVAVLKVNTQTRDVTVRR